MRWPCEQGKKNMENEVRQEKEKSWFENKRRNMIANIGCIQTEPAFIP